MVTTNISIREEVDFTGLPLPHVDITPEAKEVAELLNDLYDQAAFKGDVTYLKKTWKISYLEIAKEIGVDYTTLYRWMRDATIPINPYPMIQVRLWAKKLREQRKAWVTEAANTSPVPQYS